MIRHEWIPDTGAPVVLSDYATSGVRLLEGNLEGLGNPKTKSFVRTPALLDGQGFDGWRADPREVFWPVMINAQPETWDAIQASWWATMRPGAVGTWRVTKPDDSFRDLRVRFVEEQDGAYGNDPTVLGVETHGMVLVADDPWWRTSPVSVTFQTAADELLFYAVTSDRVFNLMPGGTVDDASIMNEGDLPAWPVIRIDGPASDFRFSQYSDYTSGVSGSIEVPEGEHLIVDTNPLVQTAKVSVHDGEFFYYQDVTEQLEDVWFFPIPAAETPFAVYVSLVGEGSMTVTITPKYFRGI